MQTSSYDHRIDDYFKTLPTWQQDICAKIRKVIHPDPENIINQGKDNLTARAIQIYEGQDLNEKAFLNLIKAVTSNNRKGGWRKLKRI